MNHTAIYNTHPTVVTIDDTSGAFDADGNQVTIDEAAVTVKEAELKAEYEAQAYARSRAAEYPPVTDYLDGIVKGDTAQVQAYIDACLAVKTKYPKPE
jgi:hypothetical protein